MPGKVSVALAGVKRASHNYGTTFKVQKKNAQNQCVTNIRCVILLFWR